MNGKPLEKLDSQEIIPATPKPLQPGSVDYAATLSAVCEAVYEWDIASDTLRWSENACDVLQVLDPADIATGRRFAGLLDPATPETRYNAIMSSAEEDNGPGVPFQIQYALQPKGQLSGQTIWVEDCGRWFSDKKGQPIRACGIVRAINARRHEEERLTYLSRYDALTGQLNRAELIHEMKEAFDEALDTRSSMAIAIARVDNLAVINDAYGFDVADTVIAKVGQRLKSVMRSRDSLGRLSGNKFGIVLRDCNEDDFQVIAERLISTISDRIITTRYGQVSTTISIGGVLAPRDARAPIQALARAHEALDNARRQYRSTACLFQQSGERAETRRRNVKIADEIVAGLNANQLRFAYQPIVSAKTRQTVYHEALLRLDRPSISEANGGALVAIAEKLGLIRLIDARVRDLAFADLRQHPKARLSLNVSAESITDASWLAETTRVLKENPDIAERTVIEITETAMMHNLQDAMRFVATLRGHGAKVAIDDFGAGYTSFHALKELGVDLVKIDGIFIKELTKGAKEEVFVRSLVDIAKTFDLETVAEWVGDEETVERLTEMGVDYFQGEHFGLASDKRPWDDGIEIA
ncbi:MAG: GGDEF-domain containing protein [Hyphomicrobiales bacterium]|nr:MAG: GGDEF-domain containing protein [Hyphomicrobiales bacterium]